MEGKPALVAFAVAVALVIACGGAPATTGGATAAGTQATASGAPTSAATTAPTKAPSATSAAPTGPRLAELLAAAKLAQYKITYKITATGTGEAFSGDQTWYFKPPRSRFDFAMNQGGEKTTVSFFSLPDGSVYCMTTGGQASCFNAGGVGSPLDQNIAAVTQRSMIEHPEQYGAVLAAPRTIAGQQGTCYTVNPVASAASAFTSGTFCYSKEGIALLSQFSSQGSTWSVEATNVSLTVPDSDFVLPAKPVTY